MIELNKIIRQLPKDARKIFHALKKHYVQIKKDKLQNLKILLTAAKLQLASYGYEQKRAPLSLKKEFYTYIFLDPREVSTIFRYKTENNSYVSFKQGKPYYVGKRKRTQLRPDAENSRRNRIFNAKTERIKKAGCVPIRVVFGPTIEALAFAREIFLIKTIGRVNLKTGPLVNLTDGGEGSSGQVYTDELRKIRSDALKGKPKSQSTILKHVAARRANGTYIRSAQALERTKKTNLERYGVTSTFHTKIAHKNQKESRKNNGKPWHSEKTRQKLKESARKVPKVRCPYCNKIGRWNNMQYWHFEFCISKPGNKNNQILLERRKRRNANVSRAIKLRGSVPQRKVICPKCNKVGGIGGIKRYHGLDGSKCARRISK